MVELSTRKREIREDGGNHHEKLELREFHVRVNWPSPIRQVRLLIRWGITPIRGLLYTIRQVVSLIYHSHSYLPYRSHLHPPSLSLSSTTLPSSQEHNVKSSFSISPFHHHELTLSAAYTEYRIHQGLAVASSFSPFRVDPKCTFSFWHTSLQIDRHQPVLHKSFKDKVTMSHSHGCELTNWWIESRQAVHQPPPSTRPISLDHSLQVHLQTRSVTASECISKLAWSRPPGAFLSSLDHTPQVHLQTRSIMASKCISRLRSITACKFARSSPPSAYLPTCSITAFKCISKYARLPPPSASSKSLNHGLGVYLSVHSIVIVRRT